MSRKLLNVAAVVIGCAGVSCAAFAQSGPLLQPGEPPPGSPQEPIHIHPPRHKPEQPPAQPVVKTYSQTAPGDSSSETDGVAPAPAVDLIHPARHKHVTSAQTVDSAPGPSQPETIPFSLDGTSAPLQNAAPASTRTAVAKTKPRTPPAANTTKVASAGAPLSGDHVSMTRRGQVLFEKDAPAPSPAQYGGMKQLADALNSALEKGASAIQLEAYGGTPKDKSSDARRLSLRRALAVRQLLIDDGVPSARIDVRAMGGTDDNGPADRVDVFVRNG
jgi:outer membrane protein OmpA-like peptidoglycan-associated protein